MQISLGKKVFKGYKSMFFPMTSTSSRDALEANTYETTNDL